LDELKRLVKKNDAVVEKRNEKRPARPTGGGEGMTPFGKEKKIRGKTIRQTHYKGKETPEERRQGGNIQGREEAEIVCRGKKESWPDNALKKGGGRKEKKKKTA